MAWIRTIDWEDAEGELREAYDWQAASLGEPAEFTMLGSLYPAIVAERLSLYRTVEHCPSNLSQIERQSAALVASTINGTAHCASGLKLKLASLGLAADVIAAIETAPHDIATGDERYDTICAHAAKLTSEPTETTEAAVEALRAVGLDALDVLDLTNMVAYYNYINRIVMGLGVRSVMSTEHEATKAVPATDHPS